MGCNCGKTASGATIVYQLHTAGQPVRTFASKTDAEITRSREGGSGTIIRTTQPAR